jgi:hypothetical protein
MSFFHAAGTEFELMGGAMRDNEICAILSDLRGVLKTTGDLG